MTVRLCANPACFCRSSDFTCSLWCGSGEILDEARCCCRHEECLRVVGLRRLHGSRPRPGVGQPLPLGVPRWEPQPRITAPRREPRPREALPRLDHLVVLAIDDHVDSRELLRQMVEALGAEAVLAENGQDALGVLTGSRPDVILCDLRMPEMDGFTFVRRLRENPAWAPIPVIAVTALGTDADYLQTWEAGFDGHLTKPIEHGQLAAVIQAVVQWRSTRRAG